MKYKVNELILKEHNDNTIDGVIDFSNKMDQINYLDITETNVYGTYSYDKYSETFTFYLTVTTKLTVPCEISLERVEVLVDFDTDLYYTFKVADDDSFEIKNNEIILDDEIWGEILLHMPVRVIKDGISGEDSIDVETENPNNPFSSL